MRLAFCILAGLHLYIQIPHLFGVGLDKLLLRRYGAVHKHIKHFVGSGQHPGLGNFSAANESELVGKQGDEESRPDLFRQIGANDGPNLLNLSQHILQQGQGEVII